MDKFGQILFDCLIALSVILCLAYIVMTMRKSRQTARNKPVGALLGKKPVKLEYDGVVTEAMLSFYTDGLYFEKDNGALFIEHSRLIKVSQAEDNLRYTVLFAPSSIKNDRFVIISDELLNDDLVACIEVSKLDMNEDDDK
ncbi:MAG: hypothetical protein E7312_04090 [Clostridiales bacterium]|nr:hypothetical protein [Clostridiales bacterium]